MMWLSFCDPEKPKGEQFLGACVVMGHNVGVASMIAHVLGCNPGGEVAGCPIPDEHIPLIRPKWLARVLTKQECKEFDDELLKRLAEEKMSPPTDVKIDWICPGCNDVKKPHSPDHDGSGSVPNTTH
jgi:hypothetical protein